MGTHTHTRRHTLSATARTHTPPHRVRRQDGDGTRRDTRRGAPRRGAGAVSRVTAQHADGDGRN